MPHNSSILPTIIRVAWASPCSALGVFLAATVLAAGGSLRRAGPAIEVAVHLDELPASSLLRRFPFAAITLGHIIVGTSFAALAAVREHEHVHVRQYELLGPLFMLAYPLASLVAIICGRSPYMDNFFERQAYGTCRREGGQR